MNTREIYLTKVAVAFGLSFILVLLLILPAYSASDLDKSARDNPYRIEEFDIDTPGDLEVRTSGGHITVEASESNRVRVEMYVRKNGRSLTPSDTDLDGFEIEIGKSGNRVFAIAKVPNSRTFWRNNNISISFVIYTPRKMSTDLKTSGGHIEAIGLDGNQRLATSGGHLTMDNLKGQVNARTSGGHIKIRDFQGDIGARTSGGHIDMINAEGTIELRTSGGHIDLRGLSGTVEATTSGGSISADLRSITRFATLRTSGGHVNITVPEGIGLNLDLRGSRVRTKLSNFSGSLEDDEVEGRINGGGPKLTARTSGGTVRVSFN